MRTVQEDKQIGLIFAVANCDYLISFSFFFLRCRRLRFPLRFAVDVVGTVSFGLDVNTIDDECHLFRSIEKTVNNGEFVNSIRTIGSFLCPE